MRKRIKILILFLVAINCYSQTSVIEYILISGNEKTKKEIILRELTFSVGDTLKLVDASDHFFYSEVNLRNTQLFNFIRIAIDSINPNQVNIDVQERWYLWPIPLIELAETNPSTWIKNADYSRIDYGFYLIQNNFRGRREKLQFILRQGFDNQYAVQYDIPYLNKSKTVGFVGRIGYNENEAINIGSKDNKRIFYKHSGEKARKEFYLNTRINYRPKYFWTHSVQLQFASPSVSDSVLIIQPKFFQPNQTSMPYFYGAYSVSMDKRDYKIYPLKGYYIEGKAEQYISQSKLNVLNSFIEAQGFLPISDRVFSGAGVVSKISHAQKSPYYIQRGLGYSENLRGYDYYVQDGEEYILLNSNIKYLLYKNPLKKLPILKSDKFKKTHYSVFLSAFFDAGYVKDTQYQNLNSLSNQVQFSYGLGLDLLTYYDQVIRIDLSRNKLRETGFFINFTKPF